MNAIAKNSQAAALKLGNLKKRLPFDVASP
jgi:hypothetical protein